MSLPDTPSLTSKAEIVIIDNDPITCLIQEAKVRSRFSQPLHVFQDAREALRFMTEAADTDFLILLDIDMPEMDGWEFLSEWQKIGGDSEVKVIMLSCSISNSEKVRSRTFPMVVDYFEKPLYNSDLEVMAEILSSF